MNQLLTIFLVIAFITLTKAFSDKEVKCKNEVVKNTETFYHNMANCTKEMETQDPADNSRKRGMMCCAVCALQKDGIFDANGGLDVVKLNASIDGSMSDKLAKIYKDEVAKCATNCTAPTSWDKTDTSCKTYKKFLTCHKRAFIKTCKDSDAMIDEDDCY